MHADEGNQLDVVSKAREQDAVGAGHEGQDHEFEQDQPNDPLAAGVEDGVPDAGKLCLLANPEVHGEPEQEDQPQVRAVASEERGETS